MSDLFKIFLTSSLTVVGGVLVLVVGRIIEKFLIEPVHEQSNVIGEIADSLIFYANLYSNPGVGKPEEMDEASRALRQQASRLMARTHAVRCYWLMQLLRIVPKHRDTLRARENLMGLSNSIHRDDPRLPEVNNARRKQIEESLHIRT